MNLRKLYENSLSVHIEDGLSETPWKNLRQALEAVDAAYVNMAEALTEAELSCIVKI